MYCKALNENLKTSVYLDFIFTFTVDLYCINLYIINRYNNASTLGPTFETKTQNFLHLSVQKSRFKLSWYFRRITYSYYICDSLARVQCCSRKYYHGSAFTPENRLSISGTWLLLNCWLCVSVSQIDCACEWYKTSLVFNFLIPKYRTHKLVTVPIFHQVPTMVPFEINYWLLHYKCLPLSTFADKPSVSICLYESAVGYTTYIQWPFIGFVFSICFSFSAEWFKLVFLSFIVVRSRMFCLLHCYRYT